MREVHHIFNTNAEAHAFHEGVMWVNDSDVECVDVETGEDNHGTFAIAICRDQLDGGDEDSVEHVEFDYREGIRQ